MDTQDRLDRGEKALADGEFRAAIIDAKNILLDEPNNAAARLLLGRASVRIGDGISGEKELRKAVELGVDVGVVLVDLGRALLLRNKLEEVIAEIDPELAISEPDRLAALRTRGDALVGLLRPVAAREIFTEVLDVNADDIAAQLGIVKSYVAERNYQQARATLDHVLAQDDSYTPAWIASGMLATRSRDFVRATNDYEKAASLAVAAGDKAVEMAALFSLSNALLAQGKHDGARDILVRMHDIAASDTRTLLVSAKVASAEADWDTAQRALQEILGREPDNWPAQMLLGYVHKESGDLGQAEMYLSAVVAKVPDNSNARRLLAETRLQLNKADAARQVLDPLLSGTNVDTNALSIAAGASISLGEFDVAAELLERSVAAEPENVDLRIRLAVAHLWAKQPDKAQEVLEAISSSAVGDDEFRRDSLMVLVLMARGSPEQALGNAKDLIARWPGRADVHSLVGSIKLSTGDIAGARSSFEAAIELAPGDVQSIRYLARLDEMEGDYRSAAERYQLVRELQPKDIEALVALARLSARSEDFVKARELLETAKGLDATAVVPRQVLGALLLALREFPEAESVIAEALQLDPKSPLLHSMMGHAKLNQGDFRGAESSFGRALELEPDEPSHSANLARAKVMRGDKASAVVALQDSIERTMHDMRAAVLLASLKADAGDLEGARSIARQLTKNFPLDAAPLALEAELLVRAGDLVAAAATYDKVLAIENVRRFAVRSFQIRSQAGIDNPVGPLVDYLDERPFDSDMRIYLAQAYQGIQDIDMANTEYERVVRDEPDNFIAANNLAWNLFESGDSRAEEFARRAYALQPDNSSVADTLGWILVKSGRLEEGIAMLRKADELGNGQPNIRYHLAAGLAAAAQEEEARSILREVLSVDQSFPYRSEAEVLLESL